MNRGPYTARFKLRKGTVHDVDGVEVGSIEGGTFEFVLNLDLAIERGDKGGLGEVREQEELPGGVQGGTKSAAVQTREAIDRVWAHYVAVMQPRGKEAGADERRIIREALRVATEDECCDAISGCKQSDFHMGLNERKRKYNRLSNILKGKRGGKTTREQIDMFIEIASKTRTGVGGSFPSADRAIVAEHQRTVQRGHRIGSPEAVQKAKDAEAWLREHGIETVREGGDGYPTFRPLRGDE